MSLNTIVFEGNLAAAPKLERTTSGTAVTDAVVLVNRRVKDTADQWVDAEPTRHRIKAWRTLAEHLANLPTGTTVLVVGTITTDAWPDKTTQEKRTADVVIVEAIGASIRYANVYVESAHGEPTSTPAPGSDDDQAGA
jgi:single-strand DNA-binding protein